MAVPRCSRSLFGSARKAQIFTPRSCVRTFSQSPRVRAADENGDKAAQRGAREEQMGEEEGDENPTVAAQMEKLGIDYEQYKWAWKNRELSERRAKAREPKTKEESDKLWQDLQKTPDHKVLLQIFKSGGVEPIEIAKERGITLPGGEKPPLDPKIAAELDALRKPINVQAIGLRPLRRAPTHGVPVCDLQLRTYSVRNIMLFADFAMRAAYFMGLAARGPVPLPRITERWTVPKSNFIFKKSQENFERITIRRLIQIQDGHPDVVKAWLAFLQKHQFHGIGMKANIWEYESLDQALSVGEEVKPGNYKGRREAPMLDKVNEILARKGFKEAMKGYKAPEIESRP